MAAKRTQYSVLYCTNAAAELFIMFTSRELAKGGDRRVDLAEKFNPRWERLSKPGQRKQKDHEEPNRQLCLRPQVRLFLPSVATGLDYQDG